jgi:hypothetical protein
MKQKILPNQCEGKRRFIDKEMAKRASSSHHIMFASNMRVYYCLLCKGFHIGHKKNRRRKR